MALLSRSPYVKSPPHVIHELDVDPVTTRYFSLNYANFPLDHEDYPRKYLTPCGKYMIETEEVDRTSHRLVSTKVSKGELCDPIKTQYRDDQRVYLDNVIRYSPRLAHGFRVLLLGENHDEKMRLLIAPREGRALEITTLTFSFNEAKRRLEAEWGKRRALWDKETGGTEAQNTVAEDNESWEGGRK